MDRQYNQTIGMHIDEPGCRIIVRWDQTRGAVVRFVVQLQKQSYIKSTWETIAQVEHDPEAEDGRDIYDQGLHIEIVHSDGMHSDCQPAHSSLRDSSAAALLLRCIEYFETHSNYFAQLYQKGQVPHRAKSW